MNSDDDYRPEEDPDDSDPDDNEEGDVGLELLGQDFDEEAYLRGSFSGDEEEDEDEEEGGQRSIFAEGQDPLSVLEGMGREDPSGRQPFELLAAANRRQLRGARGGAVKEGAVKQGAQQQVGGEGVDDDGDAPGPSNRAAVFGASVEDIWNDPLAEKLGLNPTSGRKKRRAKDRRKRLAAKKGVKSRELPEEVTKKLGEANLLYAMQKHEEAIALLLEVVRLAPNLSDPYHTLGLLHEAVGNSKKALDFYMIAAHITPKDVPLWKRLAQMSSEHGLLRQAVYCLSQVIKRDKEDLEARYDRALLYAELEDDRKAIDGFEQILAVRPSHPEVPKALARLHHRVGQQGKAVAVVERHIQQHPQATDLTHVNILAELYGEAGRWEEVLALVRRAEAEFCGGEGEDEGEGGLPVDLQVKAGIALCHLDRPDEAAQLLSCLLGEPVDQFADLYADAGSILQGVGRPEAALPYFRALAEQPGVGGAEVWARMAMCHRAMGDAGGALHVYQALVQQLAPEHPGYVEAMLAVVELHRELGQPQEADRVLDDLEDLLRSQEMLPGEHSAAVEALLQRTSVLLACGKHDAYLDLALPVLGSTLRALERESDGGGMDPALRRRLRYIGRMGLKHGPGEEGGIVRGYKKHDRRKKHVRELDERVQQLLAGEGGEGSEGEGEGGAGGAAGGAGGGLVMREILREEGPFMLLLQTGQVLVQERRYGEAREIMQAALDVCGRRWSDRWKRDALRLVLFEAALQQRDFTAAQQALRCACARWPHSPVVWNAYARYLTETGSIRQSTKYLAPLRGKHPTSLPLTLMMGHCHLLNTQYGEALQEYFHAWRVKPQEPLVLLCVAAGMVNLATTRKVPDRHQAVMQAFALFQEYSRFRGDPQEASYNLARAAHHLHLLHIAVPYYTRVLTGGPYIGVAGHCPKSEGGGGSAPEAAADGARADADVDMDQVQDDPGEGSSGKAEGERGGLQGRAQGRYDLRREAAFNLSLIFRSSGNDKLAREVLKDFMTL